MHYEIQNILSGTQQVSHTTLIHATLNYLRRGKATSEMVAGDKHYKNEEAKIIIEYSHKNNLFVEVLDVNLFISEGAEQKVYLKEDKFVWKLNDTIYYESWQDYFCNLLLNNYFFPDTAYELKGFLLIENILYAVVVQPFVKANQKTDLSKVKEFMLANGFLNTKNNDYFHPILGIILEDLHDENVLTNNDILYFIDTVFYIKNKL